MSAKIHEPQDKLEALLKHYENEQREFENHWLWRELNTTPKDFFSSIHQYIENNQINRSDWEEKLYEAKQVIETRIREQRQTIKPKGIKNFYAYKV